VDWASDGTALQASTAGWTQWKELKQDKNNNQPFQQSVTSAHVPICCQDCISIVSELQVIFSTHGLAFLSQKFDPLVGLPCQMHLECGLHQGIGSSSVSESSSSPVMFAENYHLSATLSSIADAHQKREQLLAIIDQEAQKSNGLLPLQKALTTTPPDHTGSVGSTANHHHSNSYSNYRPQGIAISTLEEEEIEMDTRSSQSHGEGSVGLINAIEELAFVSCVSRDSLDNLSGNSAKHFKSKERGGRDWNV